MDSNTRNELQKVGNLASSIAPGPVQTLMGIIKILEILLGWLSVTAEVFVRFNFGERYLSPLRLLLAWWSFQTYRSLYFFLGALFGFTKQTSLYDWFFGRYDYSNLLNNSTSSLLYVLFVYGFWGFTALHLLMIWKRDADGMAWHTQCFGCSWLTFLPWEFYDKAISYIPVHVLRKWLRMDDWKLYCILEPLLCYQAALWLQSHDEFLGSWLVIASVTLWIKNSMIYMEMRGRLLDMMDASIESRYLQAALNGTDKRRTAGFSVVPVPQMSALQEMDIAATVQETLRPTAQPTAQLAAEHTAEHTA